MVEMTGLGMLDMRSRGELEVEIDREIEREGGRYYGISEGDVIDGGFHNGNWIREFERGKRSLWIRWRLCFHY